MNQQGEQCAEDPLYQPEPQSEVWKAFAKSRQYCGLLSETEGPFQNCFGKMGNSKTVEYNRACMFDVMETSHNETQAKEMACSSLEAFVAECKEMNRGVSKDWRYVTGCDFKCPAGMIHKQMTSPCAATCANPNAPNECTEEETEGCACPDGMLLSGDKCVAPTECGCTDQDGSYYKVGESFFSEDCKQKFVCEASGDLTELAGCADDETCTVQDGAQTCIKTPVNGDWSEWSDWSACTSITTEDGALEMVQLRTRSCDNPPPQNGGTCVGDSMETQRCLPSQYALEQVNTA